jgi:malic enzyme
MWWDGKITRTFRCRLTQTPGNLGRHLVAIVTDGTAVLGLGDIGPLAAMPVMEGKASLLETLTGLSGMPILLNTKDPEEIIRTVVHI